MWPMPRCMMGASALAEAALMATAIKRRRREIIVTTAVNPEYRKVLKTYCQAADLQLTEIEYIDGITDIDSLQEVISQKTAGVIVQNPNFLVIWKI